MIVFPTKERASSLGLWSNACLRGDTITIFLAGLRRALLLLAGLLVMIVPGFATERATSVSAVSSPPAKPAQATESSTDLRRLSRGVAVVPFSLEAGEIILNVRINGLGPFPMLVDSGAPNSLTPEAAALLGVEIEPAQSLADSGDHLVATGRAWIDIMRIGDVEMVDQPVAILALPLEITNRGSAPPLAGVIGYEAFQRFVVRLDYERKILALSASAEFNYSGNGVELPVKFDGAIPVVTAAADGIPGFFAIDTGSVGAISLRREFVDAHNIETRHPTSIRIKSIGATGPYETLLTRLDRFEIAESRIEAPATRFPSQAITAPKPAGFVGTVGFEILRQFAITFDYPREKVWFERSRAFGTRTGAGTVGFQATRSGESGFIVITVLPNSAAEAAGMETGDLITEIEGQSTASMSLGDFANWIRQSDLILVHLTINRKSVAVPVTLGLRDASQAASE
jgi:hypothetical protein